MGGFDRIYDALSGIGSAHAFSPVRFNGGDGQNGEPMTPVVIDRLDRMFPYFLSFGLIVSVRCPQSGCQVSAGIEHSIDGVVWESLVPATTVIEVAADAEYLGGSAQLNTSLAAANRYLRAVVTVTIDEQESEDVDCHGVLLIGGAVAPARSPD